MRVAFLGLGAIGEPMASHLARPPFRLTVWNRTTEKATEFARRYAVEAAPSAADAVRSADVVITCLPSSREVRDLVAGNGGLLSELKAGAALVDCTSGDPASSRDIAAMLRDRDIDFVDAPVSGGVKGAVAGSLTVMCGGSEQSIGRVRPVLSAFAGKIVRCGEVGTGHAVKAMNQALLAIHIWSAGECLAALARLGVETATALEVINGSSGRSNASEKLFPERVIGRAYPRTFRVALLDKDVSIAADIAAQANAPAPFIDLAARLFREAHNLLGDEADHVEAIKIIEERAGVTLG